LLVTGAKTCASEAGAIQPVEVRRREADEVATLLPDDRWLLWLGLAFVLAVYFAPLGIIGALKPAEGKAK
jgi:ABC-type branched-subunit amino acid transport system permease subunit